MLKDLRASCDSNIGLVRNSKIYGHDSHLRPKVTTNYEQNGNYYGTGDTVQPVSYEQVDIFILTRAPGCGRIPGVSELAYCYVPKLHIDVKVKARSGQ